MLSIMQMIFNIGGPYIWFFCKLELPCYLIFYVPFSCFIHPSLHNTNSVSICDLQSEQNLLNVLIMCQFFWYWLNHLISMSFQWLTPFTFIP